MSIDKSQHDFNRLILKHLVTKQLSFHVTFTDSLVVEMLKKPKPDPLFTEVLLAEINPFRCSDQDAFQLFLPVFRHFSDC